MRIYWTGCPRKSGSNFLSQMGPFSKVVGGRRVTVEIGYVADDTDLTFMVVQIEGEGPASVFQREGRTRPSELEGMQIRQQIVLNVQGRLEIAVLPGWTPVSEGQVFAD